jgi:hypothetical protein
MHLQWLVKALYHQGEAIFNVSLHLSPAPTVTWTRSDGSSIPNETRFEFLEANARLHISVVQASDTGSYTCTAYNAGGNVTQNINLSLVREYSLFINPIHEKKGARLNLHSR